MQVRNFCPTARFYGAAVTQLVLVGVLICISAGVCFAITSIAGVVRKPAVQDKLVALTFDDGPHPVFTAEILSLLDRYQVKATFFVIGSQAERYPLLVKDMAARGHVIGNHTYSHPHNLELAAPKQIECDIKRCSSVVERIVGMRPNLFRPPYGLVNGRVLDVARHCGCQVVLWSVCADHRDASTPASMAQRVSEQVAPGCIVLLHDGGTGIRWKDVRATELIIESLSRKGYTFVTLPELLAKAHGSSCTMTGMGHRRYAQDRFQCAPGRRQRQGGGRTRSDRRRRHA